MLSPRGIGVAKYSSFSQCWRIYVRLRQYRRGIENIHEEDNAVTAVLFGVDYAELHVYGVGDTR